MSRTRKECSICHDYTWYIWKAADGMLLCEECFKSYEPCPLEE